MKGMETESGKDKEGGEMEKRARRRGTISLSRLNLYKYPGSYPRVVVPNTRRERQLRWHDATVYVSLPVGGCICCMKLYVRPARTFSPRRHDCTLISFCGNTATVRRILYSVSRRPRRVTTETVRATEK